MKLYIPELSDKIKLTVDWKFNLVAEDRNIKFAQAYFDKAYEVDYDWNDRDGEVSYWYNNTPGTSNRKHKVLAVTLHAGSVLSVDRIYIRKGAKEYSSLSFRYIDGYGRFWAKLSDVNNIEFEHFNSPVV